jgi:hypothetical protein
MTTELKCLNTNGWNLHVGTGSEVWVTNGTDRKFVARFKYKSPMANARHFVKFLTANFTPEEFFALAAAGTPVGALETKGYVPYNVLQIIKRHGISAVAGTRWA